jgi:hypothetical protein
MHGQHCEDMSCLQNITGLTYDPDENYWTVDDGCWNLTQLENVTFTLGRHQFVLRPDQYVLAVRNPASNPMEILIATWMPEHLRNLSMQPAVTGCSCMSQTGSGMQVYQADKTGNQTVFCISAIVGGGPAFTVVLGANFHRAYYAVYEYDAYTDTAQVRSKR